MVIEIDVTQLIANKLTFEEYFLLFCIKGSYKQVLIDYVKNIKKYDDETFEKLQEQGFLTYAQDSEGLILFSSLKLGDNSVKLFPKSNHSFEVCFAELLQTYPKSYGERKLHLDKARCIDLYKKTIISNGEVDINKHNLILECIKSYVESHRKFGKMQFLQALPTFLHQKNWEAYIDEIGNNKIEDNLEGI